MILPNNVFRVYFRGHIDYQVAQPETFRNAVGVFANFPLEQLSPELAAENIEQLVKVHTDRKFAWANTRDAYAVAGVNLGTPKWIVSLQPPSAPES